MMVRETYYVLVSRAGTNARIVKTTPGRGFNGFAIKLVLSIPDAWDRPPMKVIQLELPEPPEISALVDDIHVPAEV